MARVYFPPFVRSHIYKKYGINLREKEPSGITPPTTDINDSEYRKCLARAVGAILARYGLREMRPKIGYAVTFALEHGTTFIHDVDLSRNETPQTGYQRTPHQQLDFFDTIREVEVDETYYLNPDGTKRRIRKKRT
ncbi:MAG: hypothetical protein QXY45_02025 [Candidatus Aenigmatarchaeota archaeon]